MEEEGWFYFFQHAASAHTLVIANQNSAFQDISNATLYLVGGADDTTRLLDFNMSATTVRGKMTLQDYDPVKSDTLLQSEQPTVLQTGGATARDDFRWPALTFDNGTVTEPRANGRWRRPRRRPRCTTAPAGFGGLVPGGKFTVASSPPARTTKLCRCAACRIRPRTTPG